MCSASLLLQKTSLHRLAELDRHMSEESHNRTVYEAGDDGEGTRCDIDATHLWRIRMSVLTITQPKRKIEHIVESQRDKDVEYKNASVYTHKPLSGANLGGTQSLDKFLQASY